MEKLQKGFDLEAMLKSLQEQKQKNHGEFIAELKSLNRGEVKAKFKTELAKNRDEYQILYFSVRSVS